MRKTLAATALGALAFGLTLGGPDTAEAQSRAERTVNPDGGHAKSRYYRRAPQVRGFVQRRGGYSYSASDVTNTSGDSRTRFGSTNSFRTWTVDRQTQSGPFDHGFFFDSGMGAPRGGNSTNMN